MIDKPMHEIIADSIKDFKLFIQSGEFKNEEDIELAQNLKMVVENYEKNIRNNINHLEIK